MDDITELWMCLSEEIEKQIQLGEKRYIESIDQEETNNWTNFPLPQLPIDVWKIFIDIISLEDFLKLIRLNSRFYKILQPIFDQRICSMFPGVSKKRLCKELVKEMWNIGQSYPSCFRLEGQVVTRLPWDKEVLILQFPTGHSRLLDLRTRKSINMGEIIRSKNYSFYPEKKEMAVLQIVGFLRLKLCFFSLLNEGFKLIREKNFREPLYDLSFTLLEYYNDREIILVQNNSICVYNPQNATPMKIIQVSSGVGCANNSINVSNVFALLLGAGYQVNTCNGQTTEIPIDWNNDRTLKTTRLHFLDENSLRIIDDQNNGCTIDIDLEMKKISAYEKIVGFDDTALLNITEKENLNITNYYAVRCLDDPNICQVTLEIKGRTEMETRLYVHQKYRVINFQLCPQSIHWTESFFIMSFNNYAIVLPGEIIKSVSYTHLTLPTT
eukprot:TRINITY_DN1444_c0_g1_i2.p1 TRINITY_DN1444_c0_g1~~TRINITY_DN1444_c0_g1_i2.p1  ORF type:complete len:440 (+),score=53.87 TRINITY_DN1444_c0_g1_i2:34-1353(+)